MTSTIDRLSTLSVEEKRRLLAELLKKQQADTVDPHAAFPLNDMQQAFWIGRSEAVQLGNIGIHGYFELECHDLDIPRVEAAFRRLVARHDMLRAIVLPDGTQQVLREVPAFELPCADISERSRSEQDAHLAGLRDGMSHQVFDLQRWPLFELRAVKLDAKVTRLLFSIDLIIADAGSVVIIFRDWAELYHDPTRPRAALGYDFQRYSRTEPALLGGEAYQRAEQYWRARLDQLPDAPQLPLRVDPGSVVAPHFVRYSGTMSKLRWSRLKELGRAAGLTPSVLMCTAYVEVLARWSRDAHFTLNVIPNMRRAVHPDVPNMVGPCSSISLLEIDLRARASFLERARALQSRLYEDLDHMQWNGVKVLRELARRRGASLEARMPIVFTSMMLDMGDLEGLGRIHEMLTQTPQVWIDCQLAERQGALLFNWDVVEDLFPPGMIAEMFDALSRRMHALADDPDELSRRAPELLTDAALAARVRANDTAGPLRELTLHEAVWQRAHEASEREAVVSVTRRLTYGELMREAKQLAARLRARGARPNQLVAVSFPKGWEQVVGVLGVLEAGAAYLPLDPSLPQARRELLIERAGCELIVTHAELARDLPSALQDRVVELHAPLEAEARTTALEPSGVTPSDLAYVIYTSGSTGMPKGVMISHRAALNTLDDINARFAVGPQDRVLSLSSLSFDLSVYDVFGVLAAGGCVVLPVPGNERDPAHWLWWLQRERVTLWNSVPALMRILAEYAAGNETVASLRVALLSGDWIPVTLPEQIRAFAPNARVISLGGATEASIWSISYPIEQVDPTWTSIPYGTPLRNQRFHVRDAQLAHCPTWVAGELYIAGEGVALGYFGDPERSAASFVTDPRSGERLYRTGDLGRYLPDGTIEFLGRRDAQVKVSGHRIELEEIESQLVRLPEVRAGIVRALGDRHDKRLVAYLVPAAALPAEPVARATGEEELRARVKNALAEQLPEYMVPRHVVCLEQLPLSDNGKVDASKLPALSLHDLDELPAPVADGGQRDALERMILEVWQAVLGIPSIGPGANFFDLGGDSLRMVRVRRALIDKLGRDVTMLELYAHPSPARLANQLAAAEGDAAQPEPTRGPVATHAGKSRAARRARALGGREGGR